MPANNSSTVTATSPVLPPNIIRLQTPPISELSNAASTIAREDRFSDLSSSIVDISDTEEEIDSVSPAETRSMPSITVPAAPLTKKNLAKCQEEIKSAVEFASEDEQSPPPATPCIRLVQARNFLLAENTNSYPEFATRLEQIEQFLHNISQEKHNSHPSIYHEVKDLLRSHRSHIIAGGEAPIQQRRTPTTVKEPSRPVMSLPAEDNQDPKEQAGSFEWTNKLDDLTDRIRKSPSGGKEAFAISNLRELARSLNGGRLPSPQEAYCLINEQMIKENHENEPSNKINRDQLRAFENNLSFASREKKFSLDDWPGHPLEGERATKLKLGEGSLMPQEMMSYDWDRDRSEPEDSVGGYEDSDDEGEAQLLLAETPFLQKLMSDQIESDLAASTLLQMKDVGGAKDADRLGCTGVEKGRNDIESVARKSAVLTTRRFALPRPSEEKIREAAGLSHRIASLCLVRERVD